MRIAVFGLWHLGCVTAACLAAAGHQVTGLDLDEKTVADLRRGQPPVYEPGLTELIQEQLAANTLSFTTQAVDALARAEVLWVTFDTPVNDRDEADVAFVRAQLESIADAIPRGTLVLISSQVPVTFTRALQADWHSRGLHYAYSPENLRLGKALDAFRNPQRVIIGRRDPANDAKLTKLFAPFCPRLEWMSVESAEMTKHALNAFLATSVSFINEIARLCEIVGADARQVERGLKSEPRIGPQAYLAPGAAFAGGTLARDVQALIECGRRGQLATPLFSGVMAGNDLHKRWTEEKIERLLAGRRNATVAILGLAYKPGTSTIRRSSSIELCRWLGGRGVKVQAHDPAVDKLPDEAASACVLCPSAADALRGADLAILATPWPEYRALKAEDFVAAMRRPCVIDPGWFLADALANDARIEYVAAGHARQPETRLEGETDMDLTGRFAIITGSNRGLGKAIAEHFVRAGCGVLLTGRDESLLKDVQAELGSLAAGPDQPVHALAADVASAQDCRAAVQLASKISGRIDILVNNAGIYGPIGNIENNDWEEWVRAVQINLFGMVLMCRAVIPLMRARGYGKIVNLSGGGATAPMPGFSAYAASKSAVVRLTETMAEELRDAHVDVNAIAPGALNTRLLDEVLAAGPDKVGSKFHERARKQREEGGAPLSKGAELAVFLASAQSDGITGRIISAIWDDWRKLPEKSQELAKTDIYTLRRIVPADRGLKW